MSKGSTPRPFDVSAEEYAQRWEAVFGAKAKASSNKDDHDGEAPEVREPGTVPSGS